MPFGEQGHALGDILGVIRDPLDNPGDAQRGEHLAQVVRHRRAQRDQPRDLALDLLLDRVDALVVLDDAAGEIGFAACERVHRVGNRRLGAAAHLGDECAKPAQILVEGLDRVSVRRRHDGVSSARAAGRIGMLS